MGGQLITDEYVETNHHAVVSISEETSAEFDPISFLDGSFYEAADTVPKEMLQLNDLDFHSLYKPSSIDQGLRENFWKSIDLAVSKGDKKISSASVYDGICDGATFYRGFLKQKHRMAFVLRRPLPFKRVFQDTLEIVTIKMRDFVQKSEMTEANAKLFLNLASFLTERVHGPVTQRLETRNINAKLDLNKPLDKHATKEELQKQIKELESSMNPVIDVKDVTPE